MPEMTPLLGEPQYQMAIRSDEFLACKRASVHCLDLGYLFERNVDDLGSVCSRALGIERGFFSPPVSDGLRM